MDKIHLIENRIMFTSFDDGLMGRFDFRGNKGNYELYMQLTDSKTEEVIYRDKLEGSLTELNEELKTFDLEIELLGYSEAGVLISA